MVTRDDPIGGVKSGKALLCILELFIRRPVGEVACDQDDTPPDLDLSVYKIINPFPRPRAVS